ncbi:gliding motility-associated C-terminal domain-containing protein [Oceanihabitans sp. 2_MG-2023]|uniref:gliding motility-associated C-terminal domain-containing protein n=1 Tax=Oceanihabitans sp. 2_MG-2023 TaxID=3062661 RepID=UPI0026E3D9EC|nr:gliding motility-associated C-terminal domain-containing protein [Oceanihabitans sp. 2_MG-2023]MDO6598068.1 gliding motility-associated C-terminal domain-containing protein [Oceanihabitans sp. 2_MG-2023]
MKIRKRLLALTFLLFGILQLRGQDITLYQQYNGRINYTAIGNTLNEFENNLVREFCEILPSSSADLNIPNSASILAAYLYWAGSGTGDQEVTLNNNTIIADEIYTVNYQDPTNGTLTYFSCFTNITDIVSALGNTNYTFSDLDISETLTNNPGYCNNRTNFAGWSMYIIYEESSLPINQVSLFQGLEIINREVQEKTIIIENINVLDNDGAKIGFLAWEGDNALNLGETLTINEAVISNPPLNLADNAFNGTNTFTNSTTFYNVDLDVYSIQNNIAIGDISAAIKLTTQADLIILNNIITVLNSQLPDATITLNNYTIPCYSKTIDLDYTVYNINSTEVLPENTPIAFYANNILIAQSTTQNEIAIDGLENRNISLTIPDNIPDNFTLSLVVDDIGDSSGIVIELNETNNITIENIQLIPLPEITKLETMLSCDIGFNTAIFNITNQLEFIENVDINTISFYEELEDLLNNENNIIQPENFQSNASPQTIFMKQENEGCAAIYQFNLLTENCPPIIPQGFSPNNDTVNDWFNIQGLYDIFENHELQIYNRYGTLIFVGDNSKRWEGKANRGLNNLDTLLPVGTYFYVLNLNDSNFKVRTGWVYLNR